jgi:hypothetical protein
VSHQLVFFTNRFDLYFDIKAQKVAFEKKCGIVADQENFICNDHEGLHFAASAA